MYPMALVCLSPLSAPAAASFPHVGVIRLLTSSCTKPDSGVTGYTVVVVPRIPILALEARLSLYSTLNPSLLELSCKNAWDPISAFHVSRPSDVAPVSLVSSAISEYIDLAWLLITAVLVVGVPIFIVRQFLEKSVFQ